MFIDSPTDSFSLGVWSEAFVETLPSLTYITIQLIVSGRLVFSFRPSSLTNYLVFKMIECLKLIFCI